jgi:hypothetical protein
VAIFAGTIADELAGVADLHAITPPGTPLADALSHADRFLAVAVARVFG